MDLADEDKLAILEEIDKYAGVPELEDDEVTVRMYAAHKGISISKASNRLEREAERGNLACREVLHEGKRKKAYSVANGERK
jgi:hypothetical protein